MLHIASHKRHSNLLFPKSPSRSVDLLKNSKSHGIKQDSGEFNAAALERLIPDEGNSIAKKCSKTGNENLGYAVECSGKKPSDLVLGDNKFDLILSAVKRESGLMDDRDICIKNIESIMFEKDRSPKNPDIEKLVRDSSLPQSFNITRTTVERVTIDNFEVGKEKIIVEKEVDELLSKCSGRDRESVHIGKSTPNIETWAIQKSTKSQNKPHRNPETPSSGTSKKNLSVRFRCVVPEENQKSKAQSPTEYRNTSCNYDSDSSSCSTCSSSSSSDDVYKLPPRRAYGGVRISYVPNDAIACAKRQQSCNQATPKSNNRIDENNCVIS